MNYREFKGLFQGRPLIYSRDLTRARRDKQVVRNQLERWHRKGLVFKLRRGVYILNPDDRKIDPSRTYVANELYSPSYVSLEYALYHYGLIPERVEDVTSVSTKKTMRFENELGVFSYQHIKRQGFRGFTAVKDDAGLTFLIAEPEKALVDLIYLNLGKFISPYDRVFEEFYRLQNLGALKTGKLSELANLFNNRKLERVIAALRHFIKKIKMDDGI